MKNTKKKGFTIVELVIVIAVIAILAAVLIPTFTNVVEKAKKSAALQEAKNILTQYVIDQDANVPAEIDLVIKSGEYYFAVDNGQIDAEHYYGTFAEAKAAVIPATGYVWAEAVTDVDSNNYATPTVTP